MSVGAEVELRVGVHLATREVRVHVLTEARPTCLHHVEEEEARLVAGAVVHRPLRRLRRRVVARRRSERYRTVMGSPRAGPRTRPRPRSGAGMRLGFIEPHLHRYGGIRRILEFGNRLVARGHDVTFFVPEEQDRRCTWMQCDARVKHLHDGLDDALDVLVFNDERQWHLLECFTRARRRVFYALHDASLYGKEGAWESVRAPVDLQLANSSWTADQIA